MAGPDESINIGIGVTGDQAVLAVFNKLLNAVNATGKVADTATKQMDGMFSGVLGDVGKATLGLAGFGSAGQAVSTIIQKLTADYDNFIARAREAANIAVPYATAEHRALTASGTSNPAELAAISKRMLQTATAAGVRPAQVAMVTETAFSSKGIGFDRNRAQGIVEKVLQNFPHYSMEQQNDITSAVLSILKQYPQISDDQALAQIPTLGAASRQPDIGSLAEHMLPKALGATTFFGKNESDFRDVMALAIAGGQVADDPTGRRTGTSMVNVMAQFLKTAPGAGFKGKSFGELNKWMFNTPAGEKYRKGMLGPLWGAGGDADQPTEATQQMLQMMNQKMGLHSEAALLPFWTQYLRGDKSSRAWTEFEAARANIRDIADPQAVADFQRQQAAISGRPVQQAAAAQRALIAGGESMALGLPTTTMRGAVRDELAKDLKMTGMSVMRQRLAMGEFDIKSAFAETPGDILGATQSALAQAREKPQPSIWAIPGIWNKTDPLTGEQQNVNAQLDSIAKSLETLVELSQQPRALDVNMQDADGVERPAAAAVEGVMQ